MGLTLACARCHDHKSDPITAADYYALAGVFASVKIAERPVAADDIWAPVAKAREAVEVLEKQIADLKKKKSAEIAIKVKGATVQVGKQTRELDKEEALVTSDRVIQYWAELGIVLPEANEQMEMEIED